jgi:Xaa-Pro aminopeptidase
MHEIDAKAERLARVAHDAHVPGILLTTQHNFAWLTGGRTNRIDGSREGGAGALLVGATGQRYVLANTIEMPRLLTEELHGLGFEPIEFPWMDERADPAFLSIQARRVLGTDISPGADWPLAGAMALEGAVSRARALLTPEEVERYRILARETAVAVGQACRALVPGLEEREVARRISDAVAGIAARSIVTLVGADERIARYRHPVPTSATWRQTVLVAVCAERNGLVVSLSRLLCAGAVASELDRRTRATAAVFAAMLAATQPGASGRDVFRETVKAYAAGGFPDEELKHHQGGAIGYRSREWVAHPACDEVVQTQQAFAWNPTITGSKVEETVLVDGEALEVMSSSPDWPSILLEVRGRQLPAPAVLSL